MDDELKKRREGLERSFRSPLSVPRMFEIAKGLGGLSWSAGDSHHYGIHFHGRDGDGAWIQIFDYTTSEAVYDIPENRTRSIEQLESEYGIGVEIHIPEGHPDAATREFLGFIEWRLFPAIEAEPMERFRPMGR